MGVQGTAVLDFGAFPGKSDASVAVTGQAGILGTSLVEAWIVPDVTTDHTEAEHMVETLAVFVPKSSIVAGTGFTIYGFNTSQISEQAPYPGAPVKGTRLWGKWNVGWVWN